MKYYKTISVILIILVVLLSFAIVYLIKNPKIEYIAKEENNAIIDNSINNAISNDIEETERNSGVRIEFELGHQAEIYENEQGNLELLISEEISGRYYIGGDICINNGTYEDGTIKMEKIKTDQQVIDIKVGSNFDGQWIYGEDVKKGDKYDFTSTAYFLFKDGTIGKISTDDIKKGNYTITKLEQYKDIISLVICNLPEGSGGATQIYAVDINNNTYEVDFVDYGI